MSGDGTKLDDAKLMQIWGRLGMTELQVLQTVRDCAFAEAADVAEHRASDNEAPHMRIRMAIADRIRALIPPKSSLEDVGEPDRKRSLKEEGHG